MKRLKGITKVLNIWAEGPFIDKLPKARNPPLARKRYNAEGLLWLLRDPAVGKVTSLEIVLQMLYVPRMTEGLSVGVSESVSPRSQDTDDLVGSLPGGSEGSFRGILGCQGDFPHNPISDSERPGSDPGVIVPRDALLVSFVPKVGLCSAFFE
ncbi:unnamed protein product [Prunus armeniaca]